MPYQELPFSGPHRPPACEFEVTPTFRQRRAGLSPDKKVVLERIIESFRKRPETTGDVMLPGTVIGTAHVRGEGACYVLYQQFSGDDKRKYLIRLWYCGSCTMVDGRMRYDFEQSDC